ncbi:MAG: AMP-binding protein [Roseibium sp.]|uniref:AMP-binding protein n=1 Tax=Roseibium sp. TaxID=1936156 RepID=UPI00329A0F47
MAFVGDSLDVFAERRPERQALSCGPDTLSWRDLVDRIEALERWLRPLTPRGGRVALCLRNPASLLLCFLACARSGRIAVVLDPQWPADQAAAVLKAVAPDVVIDETVFANIPDNALRPEPVPNPDRDTPPREDESFYAGFTSGSSGLPKGYLRSHGSWLESFRLSESAFAIPGESRVVLPGQLTHSLHPYGAVCGLAAGQEVVLMPRFDPRAVLGELGRSGSVLYATPTQLHYLAAAARRGGPVTTVARVFSSGAKWGDADRRALDAVFPEAQLYEFYGASETSFVTIAGPGDSVPEGSVGRAAEGVDIAIGDPRRPAPPGRSGPVWVRSGLLFSGYICGTAPDTRRQDGWLTVGDHGFLDQDGFLFLTGRGSRMLVSSGVNVYPEEIENVLCGHPAVAAAVVAGLPDPVRGERLEAVVVLSAPLERADEVLMRACKDALAPGKHPRRIHLRASLTMTAGGKPDVRRIVEDLLAGEKTS